MPGNLTEEAQGICLVAAFLVCTGMRQRTFGKDVRLLQAASQQLRFPQRETTERLKACHGPGYLLHGSREQRYGVSDVSRQRIRRPQGWRHQGARILEIRLLQEAHRPVQAGEGPGQVTLAESEQTKPPQGHYEAPVSDRLGDPAPFFAEGRSSAKLPNSAWHAASVARESTAGGGRPKRSRRCTPSKDATVCLRQSTAR